MENDAKVLMLHQLDAAWKRINHVPFIVSKSRRMAVWSDIKEVLFLWCANPQCCIVLNALKHQLGYPASEAAMHPCTQSEQLLFMKQFMVVTPGTLLVDLNTLRSRPNLMVLHDMVRLKHVLSCDPIVRLCNQMLSMITENYCHTSFKIPLKSITRKKFLPSVKRVNVKTETPAVEQKHSGEITVAVTRSRSKLEANKQAENQIGKHLSNSNENSFQTCGPVINSVIYNVLDDAATKALVPLTLLREMFPLCAGFLEDVVRIYLIGRCEQASLGSICQCSVDEGIQLTRFLTCHNGFDKPWTCLTTCSLMMSWAHFWTGYTKYSGSVKLFPQSNDVSVVTLNCQIGDKIVGNRSSDPTYSSCQNLRTRKPVYLAKIGTTADTDSLLKESRHTAGQSISQESLVPVSAALCTKLNESLTAGTGITINKDKSNTDKFEVNMRQSTTSKKQKKTANFLGKEKKNEKKNIGSKLQPITNGKNKETFNNNSCKSTVKVNEVREESCKSKSEVKSSSTVTKNRNDVLYLSNDKTNDRTMKHGKESVMQPDAKNKTKVNGIRSNERSKTLQSYEQQDVRNKLKENQQENKRNRKTYTANKQLDNKLIKINQKKASKMDLITIDSNNSAMSMADVASATIDCNDLGDTNATKKCNKDNKQPESVRKPSLSPKNNVSFENVSRAKLRETLEVADQSIDDFVKTNNENSEYGISQLETFAVTGIEVSITPKQAPFDMENVEDTSNTLTRTANKRNADILGGKTTLKITSARIHDSFPDKLRVQTMSPGQKMVPSKQAPFVPNNEKSPGISEHEPSKENDHNAYQPKYISVIPKRLELKTPFGCPPAQRHGSEKFPYKVVRNHTDINSSGHRQNIVPKKNIPFIATDNSYPIVQGCQFKNDSPRNTQLKAERKRRSPSKSAQSPDKSCQSLPGPLNNLPSKAKSANLSSSLPNQILTCLKKQATNSICSILGNTDSKSLEQIAAEGKVMKASRLKETNMSDFQTERVAMWKQHAATDGEPSSPERMCKSADLAMQKKRMADYRPMSSIYTSQYNEKTRLNQQGPSFRSAICAIYSRDANKSGNISQDTVSPPMATEDKTSKQKKKVLSDTGSLEDVSNFGSSSSTTPDIYDEFARKPKVKVLKQEVTQPKARPISQPITKSGPATVNQPVVRKVNLFQARNSQSELTQSNHYTAGNSSTQMPNYQPHLQNRMHFTDNANVHQKYQHANSFEKQNLPFATQMSNFMDIHRQSMFSSFPDSAVKARNEVNSNSTSACPMCRDNSINHSSGTEPSQDSDCKNPLEGNIKQSLSDVNSADNAEETMPSSTESTKRTSSGDINESPSLKKKISLLDKVSSFVQSYASPRQSDSCEAVENLKAIASINPFPTINNQMQYSCMSYSVPSYPFWRSRERVKSAGNVIYRTAAEPCSDTHDADNIHLSRLNSQLYYRLSGDENMYEVSAGIVIPRNAELFTAAEGNDSCQPVPTVRSCTTFYKPDNQACLDQLSKQTHIKPIKKENNSMKTNDKSKEPSPQHCARLTSKIKENDEKEQNKNGQLQPEMSSSSESSPKTVENKKSVHTKGFLEQLTTEILANQVNEKISITSGENTGDVDEKRNKSVNVDSYKRETSAKTPSQIYNSPKKSFREVVEEKRAAKKKSESLKVFWESAQIDQNKLSRSPSSCDNKISRKENVKQKEKKSLKNKTVKQTVSSEDSSDTTVVDMSAKGRNKRTGVKVISPKRPKTSLGVAGRCKSKLNQGQKARPNTCTNMRNPINDTNGPSTNFAVSPIKNNLEKKSQKGRCIKSNKSGIRKEQYRPWTSGNSDGTKRTLSVRTAKSAKLFSSVKSVKRERNCVDKEDTSLRIVSALRQLSIEKSPSKSNHISPKLVARQRKLQTHTAKAVAERKTKMIKSETDICPTGAFYDSTGDTIQKTKEVIEQNKDKTTESTIDAEKSKDIDMLEERSAGAEINTGKTSETVDLDTIILLQTDIPEQITEHLYEQDLVKKAFITQCNAYDFVCNKTYPSETNELENVEPGFLLKRTPESVDTTMTKCQKGDINSNMNNIEHYKKKWQKNYVNNTEDDVNVDYCRNKQYDELTGSDNGDTVVFTTQNAGDEYFEQNLVEVPQSVLDIVMHDELLDMPIMPPANEHYIKREMAGLCSDEEIGTTLSIQPSDDMSGGLTVILGQSDGTQVVIPRDHPSYNAVVQYYREQNLTDAIGMTNPSQNNIDDCTEDNMNGISEEVVYTFLTFDGENLIPVILDDENVLFDENNAKGTDGYDESSKMYISKHGDAEVNNEINEENENGAQGEIHENEGINANIDHVFMMKNEGNIFNNIAKTVATLETEQYDVKHSNSTAGLEIHKVSSVIPGQDQQLTKEYVTDCFKELYPQNKNEVKNDNGNIKKQDYNDAFLHGENLFEVLSLQANNLVSKDNKQKEIGMQRNSDPFLEKKLDENAKESFFQNIENESAAIENVTYQDLVLHSCELRNENVNVYRTNSLQMSDDLPEITEAFTDETECGREVCISITNDESPEKSNELDKSEEEDDNDDDDKTVPVRITNDFLLSNTENISPTGYEADDDIIVIEKTNQLKSVGNLQDLEDPIFTNSKNVDKTSENNEKKCQGYFKMKTGNTVNKVFRQTGESKPSKSTKSNNVISGKTKVDVQKNINSSKHKTEQKHEKKAEMKTGTNNKTLSEFESTSAGNFEPLPDQTPCIANTVNKVSRQTGESKPLKSTKSNKVISGKPKVKKVEDQKNVNISKHKTEQKQEKKSDKKIEKNCKTHSEFESTNAGNFKPLPDQTPCVANRVNKAFKKTRESKPLKSTKSNKVISGKPKVKKVEDQKNVNISKHKTEQKQEKKSDKKIEKNYKTHSEFKSISNFEPLPDQTPCIVNTRVFSQTGKSKPSKSTKSNKVILGKAKVKKVEDQKNFNISKHKTEQKQEKKSDKKIETNNKTLSAFKSISLGNLEPFPNQTACIEEVLKNADPSVRSAAFGLRHSQKNDHGNKLVYRQTINYDINDDEYDDCGSNNDDTDVDYEPEEDSLDNDDEDYVPSDDITKEMDDIYDDVAKINASLGKVKPINNKTHSNDRIEQQQLSRRYIKKPSSTLDKLRKVFQKKYDIKNSSMLNKLKNKKTKTTVRSTNFNNRTTKIKKLDDMDRRNISDEIVDSGKIKREKYNGRVHRKKLCDKLVGMNKSFEITDTDRVKLKKNLQRPEANSKSTDKDAKTKHNECDSMIHETKCDSSDTSDSEDALPEFNISISVKFEEEIKQEKNTVESSKHEGKEIQSIKSSDFELSAAIEEKEKNNLTKAFDEKETEVDVSDCKMSTNLKGKNCDEKDIDIKPNKICAVTQLQDNLPPILNEPSFETNEPVEIMASKQNEKKDENMKYEKLIVSKSSEPCYIRNNHRRIPIIQLYSLEVDDQSVTSVSDKHRDGEKQKNEKSSVLESAKIYEKKIKKKTRKLKDVDKEETDFEKKQQEVAAAEGFIKTQKMYYDILKNSSLDALRIKVDIEDDNSLTITNVAQSVPEGIPVLGDRVITKAISEAEHALEGTGSLSDDDNDTVLLDDITSRCKYQLIEDEDKINLGGIVFFGDFVLPFVYVNGYKFTPLKDALTMFQPCHCLSICTIPRSILQKHKQLMKSFGTWEQVYKLELIKMKKGPAIKTGDMLVKLDCLINLVPDLVNDIVKQHKNTKLKRSQGCDVSSYSAFLLKTHPKK